MRVQPGVARVDILDVLPSVDTPVYARRRIQGDRQGGAGASRRGR